MHVSLSFHKGGNRSGMPTRRLLNSDFFPGAPELNPWRVEGSLTDSQFGQVLFASLPCFLS